MTMRNANFALEDHLATGAPLPEVPFCGYPKYNFVGGHNDPQCIPSEGLAAAASAVLKRDGEALAMYNLGWGGLGYPALREFVVEKLNHRSEGQVSIDNVLITSGSGQGIDFVNRLFLNSGDTVIMEEFSFSGAINKARALGAQVFGTPIDAEGIRMDDLEAQLADLKGRGTTPKYIYTIPTIQNPTGGVLSLNRRLHLIDLSKRFNVPIFEDECYADLTWDGSAPTTLYGLAPDQVVHIGSFSKTLAPAVRVGYAVAKWPILGRMLSLKSDGGTGALDQMIVSEFLTHHFNQHVSILTDALQAKLDVMVEALAREFGTAVEIWRPQGGIFVWVQFPDHIDVRSFAAEASAAGISFNPGPEWAVDGQRGKSFLRLCFALPDERTIRDGVAELARVCFEKTGLPLHGGNQSRVHQKIS